MDIINPNVAVTRYDALFDWPVGRFVSRVRVPRALINTHQQRELTDDETRALIEARHHRIGQELKRALKKERASRAGFLVVDHSFSLGVEE